MASKFQFKEKWLLLFVLVALVPFFQNMSPFDSSVVDIRDIAPKKPAGNWNSDYVNFFPSDNSGMTSLGDVQNELLVHNFNQYLRDFENRYLTIDNHTFQTSNGVVGADPSRNIGKYSRWSLGVINSYKLRLMYLNDRIFSGLRFAMETGSSEGVNFNVTQDLGNNWGLGVSHQTELRQSRVQLDYHW